MRKLKTESGTNIGGASAHNRRVILQALRINGAMTRAEIARGTGLVPQTVSNIIEELEQDRLVQAESPLKGKRGQPATPYRIAGNGAFALGMQIDQYSVRTVVVNTLGQIVARKNNTLRPGGLELNLPRIGATIDAVLARLAKETAPDLPRLVGLGLAMPAPTGVHAVKDDPWLNAPRRDHPLLAHLEAMTGLPVSLHHDASAAAVAERMSGSAIGIDNFVYVFVGYGLGGGLYVRGELHPGHDHLAGELGQIPVSMDGRMQRLEEVASLAPLLHDLGLRPDDPDLFGALESALQSATEIVAAWLRGTARHLVWLVDLLECVIDPEAVVFGGDMPKALTKALFAEIQAVSARQPPTPGVTRPQLLLGQTDVFTIAAGAASYPLARAFDPSLSAILKDAQDDPMQRGVITGRGPGNDSQGVRDILA